MKFGVNTFVTDESIRPDVLGRALEERGFESLLITEHSHIPVKRETPWSGGGELPREYYRTYDPFVALAVASTTTTALTLGTAVALLAQRDVFYTAKEVASLDVLCGGRVLFGVGAGWNREEMRNHDIDPSRRGPLLNEKLAALKAIWTDDKAEFHGDHIDFDPVFSWPKPVQRPHPPIGVGGESPAALTRLVRYGNVWMPRVRTPVAELRRVAAWLADQGRADVRTTLCGAAPDAAKVTSYTEAGVDRVTFDLPPTPEAETLRYLDELATSVDSFGLV
ncbi:LLM class F420-dependent oxidoreductase [Actinosynnema sp. ALI-1.44]|uniref:LLM class F420-dependent oxidoreductase n=1 Tax=Actinosynnema sp. ALI-1.44 TaxID=1933779 RepID=UPI00097BD24F|nr:LLM class F420-dependent oxidoreductase [Actinosynnema sp. ALI-1.44]ONI78011.1 LLM class F420-dependent oxidoreductase [Actinosynnema sp. ALI-1.44]